MNHVQTLTATTQELRDHGTRFDRLLAEQAVHRVFVNAAFDRIRDRQMAAIWARDAS